MHDLGVDYTNIVRICIKLMGSIIYISIYKTSTVRNFWNFWKFDAPYRTEDTEDT